MAAGLNGSARTTPRVRAELQAAQASTRALAAQYGLNRKTVAKWRARRITADAPMGPRQPRSTTLTEAEIRTLLARLPLQSPLRRPAVLAWSAWRRRHQQRAAHAHYREHEMQLEYYRGMRSDGIA